MILGFLALLPRIERGRVSAPSLKTALLFTASKRRDTAEGYSRRGSVDMLITAW